MANRLLAILSTALMGTGIVLLLFYGVSVSSASRAHQQGIEAFEAAREARLLSAAPMAKAVADPAPHVREAAVDGSANDARRDPQGGWPGAGLEVPDKSLWSDKRINDYEKFSKSALANEMPEGIMRIPSVKLELPVFTGTEEINLTRGAGRIEGTAPLGATGNTGIAAHRDGYFRSLKDVAVGDAIVIETLNGVDHYRIDELLVVDPQEVYVLEPTENSTLTLVTCYPFYFVGSAPQRFIVRASKL